jgi:hypothetical protein
MLLQILTCLTSASLCGRNVTLCVSPEEHLIDPDSILSLNYLARLGWV